MVLRYTISDYCYCGSCFGVERTDGGEFSLWEIVVCGSLERTGFGLV